MILYDTAFYSISAFEATSDSSRGQPHTEGVGIIIMTGVQ